MTTPLYAYKITLAKVAHGGAIDGIDPGWELLQVLDAPDENGSTWVRVVVRQEIDV